MVTGYYVALALVMTWPLAKVLPREIAGDLGDPLFNGWVLLWTSGQLLRVLHGDVSALAHYWQGNIFYSAPLTLAYSEHLTPQMLQALPVLAATHNVVLAYNLLLLATIVLSGVGTYLLVRELTGQPLAAFLAGVAFAFAPYRIDQWSHLEVLSSQWMPFALYGFRRFFVTARLRPLIGGACALVAQALSCAYYMAYFTPFAVAYCLYEMVARGQFRDRRTWYALVGAGTGALLLVGLFLWPYAQVRRFTDVGVREAAEVQQFSADTQAFATISHHSRLWGTRVRALPQNEGQGFPGFTILAFAALGVGAGAARAFTHARDAATRTAGWRRALAWTVGVLLLVYVGLIVHLLATGQGLVSIAGVVVRFRYRPVRLAIQIAAVGGTLLVVSPWCRRVARGVPRSPVAFFAWTTIAAAWLALGPTMYAGGRLLGPGLYSVLYRWVPGFDGLRVPSLHFMLVALFLAILAGLGAATLSSHRLGRPVAALAILAILVESWSVPVETHAPPQLATAGIRADVIPVYQWIRELPAGTVVAEFPFGGVWDEIGYTFAAGYHGKPIVNGYSGFFPASYRRLKDVLADAPANAGAWTALLASGATHAVVHEDRFEDRSGRRVSDWLRESGAHEVATFQTDRVFQLR